MKSIVVAAGIAFGGIGCIGLLGTMPALAQTTQATSSCTPQPAPAYDPEHSYLAESAGHKLDIQASCDAEGNMHWSATDTAVGMRMMTVRDQQGKLVEKMTVFAAPDKWILQGYVVDKNGDTIWQQWLTDSVVPKTMTLTNWKLFAVVVTRADDTPEANIMYSPFGSYTPMRIERRQADGTYSVQQFRGDKLTSNWRKATPSAEMEELPLPQSWTRPSDALKDSWVAMPPVEPHFMDVLPYSGD